jgi:hypothetical protein
MSVAAAEQDRSQPTEQHAVRPAGETPASGERGSGGGSPEQLTVNVTGRTSRALDLATKLTGDTRTDTVNRALQVYAFLEQLAAQGGSMYVQEASCSELEQLRVL